MDDIKKEIIKVLKNIENDDIRFFLLDLIRNYGSTKKEQIIPQKDNIKIKSGSLILKNRPKPVPRQNYYECCFCHTDKPENMVFDKITNTFVHLDCIVRILIEDPDDEEANAKRYLVDIKTEELQSVINSSVIDRRHRTKLLNQLEKLKIF
jgi:hypothetical protein